MLVSSYVIRLRCWLRMTLAVSRFELPNRNRSTVSSIPRAVVILQKLNTNFRILFYRRLQAHVSWMQASIPEASSMPGSTCHTNKNGDPLQKVILQCGGGLRQRKGRRSLAAPKVDWGLASYCTILPEKARSMAQRKKGRKADFTWTQSDWIHWT
jgi:hypothetical protein